MKSQTITFSAASVLLTSLIIVGTFKTGIVAALTATSTSATSTDANFVIATPETASSTPSSTGSSAAEAPVSTTATSTSAAPFTDSATSTANASSATSSVSQTLGQGQSPRATGKPALKRVHVVGSKYVDFFSDGTTIFSFPGDPLIDANLNKPDASIPTHAGLTWVSSKGMEAYDTPSGDLEPGTYAQEADGSFIVNTFDASITEAPSANTRVAFSRLDPTLDTSALPPAPKTTDASVSHSSAHLAAADSASTTAPLQDTSRTASSTPDASSTGSTSSTTAAPVASTTPTIASATSTATSTAISSSAASSSFASANDNAASTTATR